jgi:DNA-binding NtrC family response regulator
LVTSAARFSGTVARKVGVLTVAAGGTVLLDEVGELVLDAQGMLLRFLQSGEGRAVGATATQRIDVRIIAATHRNLARAVRERAFRDDLRYRLRRAVLYVPPLRERRDDIRLLVEHFRRRINLRYGFSVPGVTREAMAVLEDHHWPGNVRELETVIEQAMIFRRAEWVGRADLDLFPGEDEVEAGVVEEAGPRPRTVDDRLRAVLRGQAALQLAGERGSVTRRDLAAACRISGEQARVELVALARRGQLRRVGGGRSTRYVLP